MNNLRAGNLDKTIARLGKPQPSARQLNSRQYRNAWSSVNQTVTDVAKYLTIEQPGRSFWLSPASDVGSVIVVHIDTPGNPRYITPGVPVVVEEGFVRLFFERPTQPNVPARPDLYYVIDVSDRLDAFRSAPLPLTGANTGAQGYTAPGKILATVLENAGTAPQLAIAAEPSRRSFTIRNTSPGVETIFVTLDVTTVGQQGSGTPSSSGLVAILAPGESYTDQYTGAVGVFATAATATFLASSRS